MKKYILLTGATGFLGSHICHELIRNGYNVIALKRSFSNIWRIKDILHEIRVYDIDKEDLKVAFTTNKVDTVIHTATNYGRGSKSFLDVFESNVSFPLKLLNLSLEHNVNSFLNTDSFLNRDTIIYEYLNFYSITKKQFVEWLRVVSGRLRVFNIRLEHLYGEMDDDKKFIPMLILKFLNNSKSIKMTAGDQERDFIYVKDVVRAYIDILQRKDSFDLGFHEYSVGSGESVKIKDVVLMLKKLSCNEVTKLKIGEIPYRKNEIMYSKADLEKIRNEIGWSHKYSLKEGLQKTLYWYKNSKDGNARRNNQ
ncbi:MAG: NAD-dependent epimerase/dehydratase [Candidatus Thermoplasmatota archaeon]|jgi:nucleoside-diphosphate-sugar epimerase|nr:NAD-dependent epimerase/dehydratase [Candidatus Thermoplasmatota archaeon]